MNTLKESLMAASLVALIFAAGPTTAQQDVFSTLAGGVKARTLQAGSGPVAEPGQVATVHVIGWLDSDGTRGRELFNSRKQGKPVSFVVGDDGVMPAWNVAVQNMRPGGKRMLLIPPAMGYGAKGVDGLVPANAPLMFQIELVAVE